MKKSVYSIVLMDDVIRAVDAEAYRLGTSRSNLINQILAQHLSCVTPEMRMREIFDAAEELLGTGFVCRRTPTMLTLRTELEFRYRPTISYKVELERSPQRYVGRLTVGIRTRSAALIELFDNFFLYWSAMETERLGKLGVTERLTELNPVTCTRKLLNTGLDEAQTAEAISRYLDCLNRCIQAYFADPAVRRDYSPYIEEQYIKLIENTII